MPYRTYAPPAPRLIGYDPYYDLAPAHLARLIERSVEEALGVPSRPSGPGQPPYDPRLCLKVLVYGYATGIRSSRQLERMCGENLAFLLLTRGDTASYRTLCTARLELKEEFEQVWVGLFASAERAGIKRMGRITVDSTRVRANASAESVVKAQEIARIRQELAAILAEAEAVDAREDAEGAAVETDLGVEISTEQIRDILRQVRHQMQKEKQAAGSEAPVPAQKAAKKKAPQKKEPDGQLGLSLSRRLGKRMRRRIEAGLQALDAAEAAGLKHVSLTDPDARMMHEGCQKRIRECHSYEVATDAGLLVAGQTTQVGADNSRLQPLVAAAGANEPDGVTAVTADSGYYSGEGVAGLEKAGVDTCIPDSLTACDLHRGDPVGTMRSKGRGSVPFVYDAEQDVYVCPQNNVLGFSQRRRQGGQEVLVYKAERECVGCPLANVCLIQKRARRRMLKVGVDHAVLEAARLRFNDPAHRERYRHRADQVETIFGFLRGVLGYTQWMVRGAHKVACEASLFNLAYQLRKLHAAGAWT